MFSCVLYAYAVLCSFVLVSIYILFILQINKGLPEANLCIYRCCLKGNEIHNMLLFYCVNVTILVDQL